jgi:hypothetical protein
VTRRAPKRSARMAGTAAGTDRSTTTVGLRPSASTVTGPTGHGPPSAMTIPA